MKVMFISTGGEHDIEYEPRYQRQYGQRGGPHITAGVAMAHV